MTRSAPSACSRRRSPTPCSKATTWPRSSSSASRTRASLPRFPLRFRPPNRKRSALRPFPSFSLRLLPLGAPAPRGGQPALLYQKENAMSQVTAAMVKELREQTGAGMMDVKNALVEANGDMEEANKILRKKGLAAAGKKAGRVTAEGTVTSFVGENAGVLVEVNCETDFVGSNENFRHFADAVAKVIAGSKANSVEELNNEPWPTDGEAQTVGQPVLTMIGAIKENISIRRFVRYETAPNAVLSSYIHAGGKIGVLVELVATSGEKNDKMN